MKALLRWLGLVLLALVGLQLFLCCALRPWQPSTPNHHLPALGSLDAAGQQGQRALAPAVVPYGKISDHLKRAVIASEDDGFVNHEGVDWAAIEKAWERNAKAEAQIAKAQSRAPTARCAPKIRGGSTITQQLAKNLLLSGERTLLRKRAGICAHAAAGTNPEQRADSGDLSQQRGMGRRRVWRRSRCAALLQEKRRPAHPTDAARLAVMLPAPKRFEKTPGSAYLAGARGRFWGAWAAQNCLDPTTALARNAGLYRPHAQGMFTSWNSTRPARVEQPALGQHMHADVGGLGHGPPVVHDLRAAGVKIFT